MSGPVAASRRFNSKRNPCPICGGGDDLPRGRGTRCNGFLSTDGRWAHCSREEHAGGLAVDAAGTCAHRLDGRCGCGATHRAAPQPAPRPNAPPRPYSDDHFNDCEAGSPWDYRREDGELAYRKARHRGKDFRFYHRNGSGWVSGRDAPPVLLDLPDVRQAIQDGRTLILTEGEAKARMLQSLGFAATSPDVGAPTFRQEDAQGLRGAPRVVIVLDNDRPGRERADRAAPMLHAVGVPDVRVLLIPELKQGEGIDDWLSRRRGKPRKGVRCELEDLMRSAPRWEPTAPSPSEVANTPPEQSGEADSAKKGREKARKQGRELRLRSPEPWSEAVGADVADEIRMTLRRYVALQPGVDVGVTLWVLHAHAHDAFEVSPILTAISPTKRCGKTTLLCALLAVTPKPLIASNLSPSALFRTVEGFSPTMLIDEADSFLKDNEDLRGLLNSGHTRSGAQVVRVEGDQREAHLFTTWCPKAIALIGKLPGTLEDRSVIVPMRRRAPNEKVDRLRLDRLSQMEPIRRRAWTWAQANLERLRELDPETPEALNDRAADNWRPLIAIADLLGGDWPRLARTAALALSGEDVEADESPGVLLLQDLRSLFDGKDRMTTAMIIEELVSLGESRPWSEWRNGLPITATSVARLLKPFDIAPDSIKVGEKRTLKGYYRDQFTDAWNRYPPSKEASKRNSGTDCENTGRSDDLASGTEGPSSGHQNATSANSDGLGSAVPDTGAKTRVEPVGDGPEPEWRALLEAYGWEPHPAVELTEEVAGHA